jgi:phospholipid-binding lipoprotein MlaA
MRSSLFFSKGVGSASRLEIGLPLLLMVAFLRLGVSSGHAQSATPVEPAPAPGAATKSASIFDEEPATIAAHPIPDKIEGFNRDIFKFNDGFYQVILRPLSKGYSKVLPRSVRRGIEHFFHNLGFPTRFVGNVLEGRPKDAAVETGRFFVNTVTSLGFVATADQYPDLQERPSDLGLAFGSWGIGHGTYLVLPILGPSSIRDGIGLGLSGFFLDPVHYIRLWEYRYGASALMIVNQAPDQLRAYDQLKAAAVDPYVALRDAYASERANHVGDELGAPVVSPPRPTSAAPQPGAAAGR